MSNRRLRSSVCAAAAAGCALQGALGSVDDVPTGSYGTHGHHIASLRKHSSSFAESCSAAVACAVSAPLCGAARRPEVAIESKVFVVSRDLRFRKATIVTFKKIPLAKLVLLDGNKQVNALQLVLPEVDQERTHAAMEEYAQHLDDHAPADDERTRCAYYPLFREEASAELNLERQRTTACTQQELAACKFSGEGSAGKHRGEYGRASVRTRGVSGSGRGRRQLEAVMSSGEV